MQGKPKKPVQGPAVAGQGFKLGGAAKAGSSSPPPPKPEAKTAPPKGGKSNPIHRLGAYAHPPKKKGK